uniref:RING-type domain-containing protein n=1 Tax=Corethron hystrix TaxID=216773 RepID=A0A7S1C0C8_9STRA|mmetsp:Transcript_7273/g.15758  ORF Transcript_7273/g.15758 Transcript_7273/m.15758 type:complete len:277 (+) Transcript_7273:131-961(+)
MSAAIFRSRNNSPLLKLLMIINMLLLCSPFSSIVRLLWTLYEHFYVSEPSSRARADVAAFLSQFPEMRGASVEEIFRAVLDRHASATQTGTGPLWTSSPIFGSAPAVTTEAVRHDLAVALPYLVALFVCLVSLLVAFLGLVLEGNRGEEAGGGRKRKRKVRRILRCLEGYAATIAPGDVLGDAGDGERPPEILAPAPGETAAQGGTRRRLTGTCAVCLEDCRAGERIVWSSNRACPHFFHYDCLVPWIERRCSKLCPCCRQHFVDEDLYRRIKKME